MQQQHQQIAIIPQLQNITGIIAGDHHSIALTKTGIWVWGRSTACNLGIQAKTDFIDKPIFMEVEVEFDSASAGSEHSFVWKENQVYCWGSNRDFKLGLEEPREYELTKLDIFTEAVETGMKLCQLSCGDSHSLAAFKMEEQDEVSYQIFAWGESKNYQLALEAEGVVSEPILIDFSQSVRHINSKSDYNFIVTLQGDCYSWGTNLFGRLGFANSHKNQKIPTRLKALTKIHSISMGKYHCIGISQSGQAFSWGHGMHGQLGLGQIVSEATPTKIDTRSSNKKVVQSACGEYHSLILMEDFTLLSCGSNAYNALGHSQVDSKKRCKVFTKVLLDNGLQIKKIVSGNRHNLLLTHQGLVYSWGCNKYGQLGRITLDKEQQSKKEMKLQISQSLIKRWQQKQDNNSRSKEQSPFIDPRLNSSPNLKESQVRDRDRDRDAGELKDRLVDWKTRYQKFKTQYQLQQKQFMAELTQLLNQPIPK